MILLTRSTLEVQKCIKILRDEEGHRKFRNLMLDLPAGEGPKTAPSKIAIALEGPSGEMGSSLYGFYLWFAQDQVEFQRNLGSCWQTYQDGSLHPRQIHILCGSVRSAVYQRDSTPTWCTGGVLVSIVSNRDTRFTSQFWKSLKKALRTQLRFSTIFYP